jgi:hypothetical protein
MSGSVVRPRIVARSWAAGQTIEGDIRPYLKSTNLIVAVNSPAAIREK